MTLLASLESRARALRARPGFSAIFLLNNVSYIRREVLSSQIGDLLGEICEDSLNKRMRSTKASYLDIWSPLVSALLDAGLDQSGAAGAIKAGIGAVKGVGTERRELKDRVVRFHDAFEEVEMLHGVAKLDEGEAELRERLKGEVERMVIPTWTKFIARHRNDFSKSESSAFLRAGRRVPADSFLFLQTLRSTSSWTWINLRRGWRPCSSSRGYVKCSRVFSPRRRRVHRKSAALFKPCSSLDLAAPIDFVCRSRLQSSGWSQLLFWFSVTVFQRSGYRVTEVSGIGLALLQIRLAPYRPNIESSSRS
jgi:hypothetical protein